MPTRRIRLETLLLVVAVLDIGIYCGDPKERVVCETAQRMDLRLTDDSYQRFLRDGAGVVPACVLSGRIASNRRCAA